MGFYDVLAIADSSSTIEWMDGRLKEFVAIIVNVVAQWNYVLMEWIDYHSKGIIVLVLSIGTLIGMSPLRILDEHTFFQIIAVAVRRVLLYISAAFATVVAMSCFIYKLGAATRVTDPSELVYSWLKDIFSRSWPMSLLCITLAGSLRFSGSRYAKPYFSRLRKRFGKAQPTDKPSDIRDEMGRHKTKDFLPRDFYKPGSFLMGVDANLNPIYVKDADWYETNVQMVAPTRFGKGVMYGVMMDQSIDKGDCVFYVDPKKDKYAAHLMYQAARRNGRKFYYLTLHDEGIGKWSPFAGGPLRKGLARVLDAMGLQLTGDPGTDYYKSQERRKLIKSFRNTRDIDSLLNSLGGDDSRLSAELESWSEIKSLRPKKGTGFSIEKALLEGAVVYVQGDIDDDVVRAATRVFIVELIQEAKRLDAERKTHLSAYIDEVAFLVSKDLAKALATAVGFRVNFVLAHQSILDLTNLPDVTEKADYVSHSIKVNSQIKLYYAAIDEDTAKFVAGGSGTIAKQVTKLEKAGLNLAGGEEWDYERGVGMQEENHVSPNVVLALPKRVCVFKQPEHLGVVMYTAFVPVEDMNALSEYLRSKEPKTPSEAPGEPKKPTSSENAPTTTKKVPRSSKSGSKIPNSPAINDFVKDHFPAELPTRGARAMQARVHPGRDEPPTFLPDHDLESISPFEIDEILASESSDHSRFS